MFDADFNFQCQINSIVKSCNYHMIVIRDFRRVRKHLSFDTAIALANALVSSRLDYCNSLLYSVPAKYLDRLHRVQNSLARVVTLSPRLSHTTPMLQKLHWLPITSRIHFKIATLIYKCIHFNRPNSLANQIHLHSSKKSLRSVTFGPFLSRENSKAFGRRSFSNFAPVVWNNLPFTVRQSPTLTIFRRQLKTHFFANTSIR